MQAESLRLSELLLAILCILGGFQLRGPAGSGVGADNLRTPVYFLIFHINREIWNEKVTF